jgi:phospholipid transport system substrate-binding protein
MVNGNMWTICRVVWWQVIVIGVVSLQPLSAQAADSPLNVVRIAVTRAQGILQNPALQDETRRQERTQQVWSAVEPYFDLHELSQRTLGIHWRERTPQEQQEFVSLFTSLIEQTYSHALTKYTSDVQISFDNERVEGMYAEVDTTVRASSLDKTIPMQYRLHQVNGNWRIYDVVIENVSLVQNYRAQFNRILSRSSYQELVKDIKSKVNKQANS